MPDEDLTPEEQLSFAQHEYYLGRWQMIADYHTNLEPTRYDSTYREGDDAIRIHISVDYNHGTASTGGVVEVGSTAQEQNPATGEWIIEAIPEGGTPAADFRTERDKYVLDVNTGEFWNNATGPWSRHGTVTVETLITPFETIPQSLTYMLPV